LRKGLRAFPQKLSAISKKAERRLLTAQFAEGLTPEYLFAEGSIVVTTGYAFRQQADS
jgi:hypothetical protein